MEALTKSAAHLSSQHLYRFTPQIEYLQSILKNGFEHRVVDEVLPFTSFPGTVWSYPGLIKHEFQFLAVCFCDIPEHSIKDHSNQYGKFGMVMKKEWGMSQGVTPIRYIHHGTPDFTDESFYSIRETLRALPIYNGSICQMIMGMLQETEGIPFPTPAEFEALPEKFQRYFTQVDADIRPFILYTRRYLGLLRAYEGDWTDRETGSQTKRKFYDEMEWRSLKTKKNQGNLIFEEGDVIAILVPSESENNEVRDWLRKEGLPLEAKVRTLQEYLESNPTEPPKNIQ